MGKPKISVEDCCKEFYDSHIFHSLPLPPHPNVVSTDAWYFFLDNVSKLVAEDDPSFSVDRNLFQNEMTAIRMELFALAWVHKFKQNKYTFPQSFFTRHYLEQNDKLYIWDAMGEYNRALAQSFILTETGEQMAGRKGDARAAYINGLRFNSYYKWSEANIRDSSNPTKEENKLAECVGRVFMRIGVDMRRAELVAAKLLAFKLVERLGCNVNLTSQARFRLAATIFGFYRGAQDYLKSVSLA